jgi:hypothetical protein
MFVTLDEGHFDTLTGGIFASWFILDPTEPTASAAGFAETAQRPWSLFYRWMRPAGGKAYLGAPLDQEISAASGDFGELFFNLMIGLNNHLLTAGGCKQPVFAGGAPTFIRTNGNPEVDAVMRWLFAHPKTDWGQELYLRETYGPGLSGSVAKRFSEAYEKYKKQRRTGGSEALFGRWWTPVTSKARVEPSAFRFAQAWVTAVHARQGGQLDRLVPQGGWMSYSELARFFDDFHMPLLPPEVDERLLLESLGPC